MKVGLVVSGGDHGEARVQHHPAGIGGSSAQARGLADGRRRPRPYLDRRGGGPARPPRQDVSLAQSFLEDVQSDDVGQS